jgi:hypothetical protein
MHLPQPIGKAIVVAVSLILAACAQQNNAQSYGQAVLNRPLPANAAEFSTECSFLDSEIARQKAIALTASSPDLLPDTAVAIQNATRSNIAALQSRALIVQCATAAPSSTDAIHSGQSPISR